MSLEHGRPDDFDGTVYDDRLYTRKEAAKILGVRTSTLEQDATRGHLGIDFIKLGNLVRYRGATLKQVMLERARSPVGAPK